MIQRIVDKIVRELYRLVHPKLWGKGLQINGVPKITDFKNLELGRNVSVNRDVYIQISSGGGVRIGNNVTLSKGCSILTEGLDTTNYLENAQKRYRDHIKEQVTIGDGTWIAAGVIICPGVEIAENSIVAAGSVVANSLTEAGAIYGGVPARKIKEI